MLIEDPKSFLFEVTELVRLAIDLFTVVISSSVLESEVVSSSVAEDVATDDVVGVCNCRRSLSFPTMELEVSTTLPADESPPSFMPRASTDDAKSSKINPSIASQNKNLDQQRCFIF